QGAIDPTPVFAERQISYGLALAFRPGAGSGMVGIQPLENLFGGEVRPIHGSPHLDADKSNETARVIHRCLAVSVLPNCSFRFSMTCQGSFGKRSGSTYRARSRRAIPL